MHIWSRGPVAFFFCVSGFLLSYHLLDPARPEPRPGAFLLGRLCRIFPLYLAAEIITLVVCRTPLRWDEILTQVFAIKSWLGYRYVFCGNIYGWFVGSLFFCYIMFVWLVRLQRRHPRAFIAVTALYVAAIVGAIMLFGPTRPFVVGYSLPPTCLAIFMIGMCLAQWCSTLPQHLTTAQSTAMQIATLLILIVFTYFYNALPDHISWAIYWWGPIALLVVCAYMLENNTDSPVSRFLAWKPMQTMGNISFAFFIFEFPWLVVSTFFAKTLHQPSQGTVFLIFSLILYLPVAWLIHRFVETKLTATLQRLLKH